MTSYYQRQEGQFVHAYTRKLPNLGAHSTQRVEGLHPLVKSVTNRHTPIKDSVRKICDEVRKTQVDYETLVNDQRRHNPRLMDRDAFKDLTGLITHEAIDLISRELDAAKILAEEYNQQISLEGTPSIEPTEGCMYDCELPFRYGLPCKCWLYRCVVDVIPIPISFIHPRWFFDGPPFVISWRMSFDPALSFTEMLRKATEKRGEEAEENEEVEEVEEELEEVEEVEDKSGDKFRRAEVDLLHAAAHQSIDFHKSIENKHRGEEFARGFAEMTAQYTKKWQEKELARSFIPTTFPDEIRPKDNLKYKKGGSRRRAYTGREAAEAEEADQRRAKRRDSIEKGRRQRHEELDAIEGEIENY